MELSFEELREKEIIDINSGKKLGNTIDLIFDTGNGRVVGISIAGDKKLFKKSEEIFISLGQIYNIGDDVVLIATNNQKDVL